jgi:hypothetical protein
LLDKKLVVKKLPTDRNNPTDKKLVVKKLPTDRNNPTD